MRWSPFALCLTLSVAACKKDPSFERPFVDRNDGVLPELRVPLLEPGAVSIDGHLTESAWQRAAASEMFVEPGSGHVAKESKVNGFVRVARDADKLYVGFVVHDTDPGSPFSRDDVDPHVWARASGIEVMLQPGDPGNNRDYYELQVDVAGAVWDTHFDDYNQPVSGGPDDEHKRFGHQEWASGVERQVSVDRAAGKYEIEIALPWRAFSASPSVLPPASGNVWRANFYSFRDGQAQSLAWSPLLGQGNFHRASRFGRLRFE